MGGREKIELKHNFATMLVWEEVTGQPFTLASVTEIVKYAYICYLDAGGKDVDLLEFSRQITAKDIESLVEQMKSNTPRLDDGSGDGGKKKA